MELETDQLFANAIRDAIREGVKSKFAAYNSPFDGMVKAAIEKHDAELRDLLNVAIASCVSDSAFCNEIALATRTTLAKTLVQRFGGEIEKQVNALKSDPTTRARIVMAIDEIVKSQSH